MKSILIKDSRSIRAIKFPRRCRRHNNFLAPPVALIRANSSQYHRRPRKRLILLLGNERFSQKTLALTWQKIHSNCCRPRLDRDYFFFWILDFSGLPISFDKSEFRFYRDIRQYACIVSIINGSFVIYWPIMRDLELKIWFRRGYYEMIRYARVINLKCALPL